jgi:hypothetical protein
MREREKNNDGFVQLFENLINEAEKAVNGVKSRFCIMRPTDGKMLEMHQMI